MSHYLPFNIQKLFKQTPYDPYIQRRLDILFLLVGEEETEEIKAGLRSYVDELATGDPGPPSLGLSGY